MTDWTVYREVSGRVVARRTAEYLRNPPRGSMPLWHGPASHSDDAFVQARHEHPAIAYDRERGWHLPLPAPPLEEDR